MKIMAFAVATASVCAFAEPFTYDGHWPSGTGAETATEVVVPDGVPAPIADADDVAAVARLTSISLGSGAKVEYTASTPLSLSASVSGAGVFSAVSAGDLTLSGDNSGLVSPGCFFFSNTAVTVSSRYGLGSTNSAQLVYWFGGKVDPLHFTGAGLTNDAPLRIRQGTANYNCVIGPDNADETLVVANDMLFDGGKDVYFRNKVRICGGTFGANSSNLYMSQRSSPAEIWFEGDAIVKFAMWFIYEDQRLHLGWSGMTGNRWQFYLGASNNKSSAVCERSDVFADLNAYNGTIRGLGTLDLNGFDQTIYGFEQTTMTVTSDSPATLTLAGAAYKTFDGKFSGKAGFNYAPSKAAKSTCTNQVLCETSGPLTVSKGTLVFAEGAGWSGTNVVVKSGAKLVLDSSKAMTNETATLVVEDGGKIVLHSGAVCKARTALIGPTSLESGETYTVRQLKDMGLEDLVEGDDAATITMSISGEVWNGWPTTPGARATVPIGETVYVSDDDVAVVESLGAIRLREGSCVVCTNWTRPLALAATVTGSGMLVADGTAPIVLNGNNAGLVAPGMFCFTNTDVIVSNRYGLGSVDTAMVTFHRGSGNHDLRFGGPGLVCDAPIQYASAASDNKGNIGPDSASETLVFSNSFRIVGKNPVFYFRNRIRFSGGTFRVGSGHLYSNKAADSEIIPEVWFDSGVMVRVNWWFAADCIYHLGWDSVEMLNNFIAYTGAAKAICESANVLSGGCAYKCWGKANYLDLNGIDQSIYYFSVPYVSGEAMVVTSAAPACVTVTRKTTESEYLLNDLKFCGAAGYTQSAACTNTFRSFFSDTTGPLTVEKGGLRLTSGAGWGGTNVLVKSGATLLVDASSMTVAFGSRALQGHPVRTTLEIEAGGTLELSASESPAVVRSLKYNGSFMPSGRYTKSSGVGIAGDGFLYVRSSTGGEPGAMVIVY